MRYEGENKKRLRTIYKKIENLIVDGSRIFLTFLSLISLLLVFVTTILGISFYFDRPNINSTKLPNWSFYENELFPRINSEPSSKNENSENSAMTEYLISKDTEKIYEIFRNLFEQSDYSNFSAYFTKKGIEDYLSGSKDRELVSNEIIRLFNSEESKLVFSKIGSFDNKVKLIEDTLDLLLLNVEEYKLSQEPSEIDLIISEENNLLGLQILGFSLIVFVLYLFTVVYILLFKVEVNLREISRNE